MRPSGAGRPNHPRRLIPPLRGRWGAQFAAPDGPAECVYGLNENVSDARAAWRPCARGAGGAA
jgi:hypothetical protein